MKKAILLTLILAVLSAGVAFAQEEDDFPKNVITVDLGPTVAALLFGGTSSALEGMGKIVGLDLSQGGFKTSGFGIGAQYERLLTERVGVAGRFAYMQMGTGSTLGDFGKTSIDITSFSIEAHIKYFFDETMFVDAMLGYANMTAKFGYEVSLPGIPSLSNPNPPPTITKKGFEVPRDYLKLGVKLGWRFDFGEPGGFVFEPSFGWSFGISNSPTIVDKASAALMGDKGKSMDSTTKQILEFLTGGFDGLVFVGGPRVVLAVGWLF